MERPTRLALVHYGSPAVWIVLPSSVEPEHVVKVLQWLVDPGPWWRCNLRSFAGRTSVVDLKKLLCKAPHQDVEFPKTFNGLVEEFSRKFWVCQIAGNNDNFGLRSFDQHFATGFLKRVPEPLETTSRATVSRPVMVIPAAPSLAKRRAVARPIPLLDPADMNRRERETCDESDFASKATHGGREWGR